MAICLNAFLIQKQSINISPGYAECTHPIFMDLCLSLYQWHCNSLQIFQGSFGPPRSSIKVVAETGIMLTTTKCHFTYQSLLSLGQKVSHLGLSTHMKKVSAILNLDIPRNVHNLQIFLGIMVYFSSYIPFYAWIATPLFSLLKKETRWEWTNLHSEALGWCKQVLTNTPVWGYTTPGSPY